MSAPLPPEQNIGPYYALTGIVGLGVLVWVISGSTGPTTWQDIAKYAIVGLLALAFWRPKAFDIVIRRVATLLPFTKYGRDQALPEDRGAKVGDE